MDNLEQQKQQVPHLQQQTPIRNRTFLLSFLETEGERFISIKAPNILAALEKFSKTYQQECGEWTGISINVEEIDEIQ